jgi:hypothetical protein
MENIESFTLDDDNLKLEEIYKELQQYESECLSGNATYKHLGTVRCMMRMIEKALNKKQ